MQLQQWLHRVKTYLPARQAPIPPALLWQGEARRALHDLHAAESYFNSISDPELVEYAAYEVEAARRKYEYLLRRIRRQTAGE